MYRGELMENACRGFEHEDGSFISIGKLSAARSAYLDTRERLGMKAKPPLVSHQHQSMEKYRGYSLCCDERGHEGV